MAVSQQAVLRDQNPAVPSGAPSRPEGDDWTKTVADAIETVVSKLRDRTTVPLTTVARALVYGLVAAVLGTTALVLLVIALVRFVESYLPFGDVWLPYGVVGAILVGLGLFIWRRRQAPLGPQTTSGRPATPERRR